MAYFSIIRDRDNKRFDVVACHLNFWILPGILGRKFLLDVGIRIKAAEDGLTAFLVTLPVAVSGEGVMDLHDVLLNPGTAELVFGRPINIRGQTISYANVKDLDVGRISEKKSTQLEDWSDSRQSCCAWRIELADTLNAGQEQYLRFRFPVEHAGNLWLPKRTLLALNGALIDLRVADIRESQEARDWASFRDRIVPINKLNAFVVAPVSLHLRSASPMLKYVRLLEGLAWKPYIRRRTGIWRFERLVI